MSPEDEQGKSSMNTSESGSHRMVIESTRGWASLGLRDVWEYRELLGYLIWREIQGVYRQTALGITWLFLRPLVNVILLTVVFGRIVKVPSDDIPYGLFSLAALLPWGFFSNAVQRSSRSLVDNMHVISKVYFPRLVVPIAGAASGLLDFGASLVILFGAMLVYRMPLRVEMLCLPGYLLVALMFALALGLWLATLSVKYRDVSFAVNFLLMALMYASPVIYPISMVPEPYQVIYQLNPMSGVIQGFRWSLYGSGEPPGFIFLVSIGLTLLGLVSGMFIFRRTERTVVDIL
jgi:lipopolysaccharide transport system permease protein